MITAQKTGNSGGRKNRFLPLVVIFLGIIMMLAGIYFEETLKIFDKATMICLQCIGIG